MQYEHGGNIHKFLREQPEFKENLLDFSANINPFGLSELGKKSMLESLQWLEHYPDPDYYQLKSAMAAYYKTNREWLSLYNGAAEGMHELFRFLSPKRAMLLAPTFIEYEKALSRLGVELFYYTLKKENEFNIEKEAFLIHLELERPNLLVICTPNNPTGQLTEPDFLEKIAERLKKWKGQLVVDEAFIDFLPNQTASMVGYLGLHENLHIMRSFTKFFGVPGLRLGAVLTANSSFHENQQTYGVPWRVNTMAEHYALGALEDKSYIENSRELIVNQRSQLLSALADVDALKVYKSFADYMLLDVGAEKAKDFEQGLRDRGILIRNCSNYKGLREGYFRIAIKEKKANERLQGAILEVVSQW